MARFVLLIFSLMIAVAISPAPAHAQVQTFFVQTPTDEASQLCASEFTATLVNYRTFRAQQDASTQRTVTQCLGEIAGSASQRECALSMANIEVDFLVRMRSNRLGEGWNWTLEALSPSQGSAQVWGGSDIAPQKTDRSEAAYASCRFLAMKFACLQETTDGCVDSQAFEAERRRLARTQVVHVAPGPVPVPNPTQLPPEPEPAPIVDSRVAGWVVVSGLAPSNATIAVDGAIVGTGNGEYPIAAGQRSLVISAPGHEDFRKMVRVSVGSFETIENVNLKRIPSFLQTRDISPSGAAILIDGEQVGSGSGRFEISAGDHIVTIVARGYSPVERKIRAAAGSTSNIDGVNLERAETRLKVEVNPGNAEVTIDNSVVLTGNGTVKVTPGAHRVQLSSPGYQTYEATLVFEEGVETALTGLELTLTPASLRVKADEQQAEVWLDRLLLGIIDADREVTFEAAPGTYLLTVGKMGYVADSRSLMLGAGETVAVEADLRIRRDLVLGITMPLSFGTSYLIEPFLDDARIARANGFSCDSGDGCAIAWDRDAALSETTRFELRGPNGIQSAGPDYSVSEGGESYLFMEARPDVVMTFVGSEYDSSTGNFSRFERRVPWSRVTFGCGFMTERDGFDLDYGFSFGMHYDSFGKFADEFDPFLGPRMELAVPLTDRIYLTIAYDLTLDLSAVESTSVDLSGGSELIPDPPLTQRLGLGLEVGF